MDVKARKEYAELKEALDALKELGVSEHLEAAALTHLLGGYKSSNGSADHATIPNVGPHASPAEHTPSTLRAFASSLSINGAVGEIPCLLYWSVNNENVTEFTEDMIVELYRRSGLRPPKDVAQSMRDLSSKKYGRLAAISGRRGAVKLTRVGEDFVIHDVINKKSNSGK